LVTATCAARLDGTKHGRPLAVPNGLTSPGMTMPSTAKVLLPGCPLGNGFVGGSEETIADVSP